MSRKSLKATVFLLLVLNLRTVICLEPITSSIVGAIGAIGLGAIYSTWDYLKCSSHECCHNVGDSKRLTKDESGWHREPWIDYQMNKLDNNLNHELHGQHLVKTIVPKLIRQHMRNENPEKALVLSFHGWTGSGKNFVSEIVARNIFRKYRDDGKSNFVRHFICNHFNTNDKLLIKDWIKNNITNVVKTCQRSLFIFDEIDKLPEGVIDAIKPFVDYNKFVDSIDYRKTIFIFLRFCLNISHFFTFFRIFSHFFAFYSFYYFLNSNTGGTGITKKSYEFHLLGKKRTDLRMKDLEPLINSGAFNENGGLHRSDIVEKNLINAFVPFLPLEKRHIKLCIIDYLKLHHNYSDPLTHPGEEFIREVRHRHFDSYLIYFTAQVANEMEYYPPDTQIYSRTGCKRVGSKVDASLD